LNGQTGLFVARISGLAEEVNGWQAFFATFFKFFARWQTHEWIVRNTDFVPARHACTTASIFFGRESRELRRQSGAKPPHSKARRAKF
jgi:hypothetical protein